MIQIDALILVNRWMIDLMMYQTGYGWASTIP